MNSSYLRRSASRLLFAIFLLVALLLIAACQPIVDPALLEGQSGAAATEAVFEVEPAKATIDAASLRVRQGPGDDYERVAGVTEGESYEVLAMTSDGAWIQLAVEDAPDGQGWVSTEFVTLEGDITNIATVPADGAEADAAAETGEADTAAQTEEAVASETDASDSQGETTLNAVGEALIQTPLPLRVRSEPDDTVDNKIGSVYNLEEYPVLDISDDGQWILIDVPRLSDNGGWVWWENVVISGEIADRFAELTGGATEGDANAAVEGESPPAETEAAENTTTEADTAEASEEPAEEAAEGAADEVAEEPTAEPETEDAAVDAIGEALIQTPLPLRVRSEPTDAVDNKIGNVFNGETYPVLEISEDGLWVKLDVPELAEDGGWVSAEYVVLDQ